MVTKEYKLDFGTVEIHDNILIARLNEGILFNAESNRKLLELGTEIFMGKPYGYISHRVNSYAVDPMVYKESAASSSLKAIAVVSANSMTRKNAENLEKKFYKDTNCFEVFETLEAAKIWLKDRI